MWCSLDNLFYGLVCLLGVSAVPVYVTWLLSRNVAKLNKPCNLFIWTVKRGCVVIVTICLPATVLELSSNRTSGEVLRLQESDIANRYLIFQVISALKYIILGILPWMITCTTLTFNVRRLSYKIVSLQMFFIITLTFCLSIGIVSSSAGSIWELVLISLYCHLCTITPITLIVWNTIRRWRRQTNSISTRTPIYSSACISCLWILVVCTFLPADFILLTHLLSKHGFIPNVISTMHDSSNTQNLLLSENLKYISDFIKYMFVTLFPIFLLTSKQFRSILAVAAHRKWQNLSKRIGRILKAEAEKRSSVVSVTSTSGPQRSFSVVINEHHLCLHSTDTHEHCHSYQHAAPAQDPFQVMENFQLAVNLPSKIHVHPKSENDAKRHNSLTGDTEDLAAIDLQSLKIDLHQLHTTYDEFCQGCVRDKLVKDSKRKKVVKLRPGRLIHDEGKKIKVGSKKEKSLKYLIEGKSVEVNKEAGSDPQNNLDIRGTLTALGQSPMESHLYQSEKSSVGSLLALVE